MSEASAVTRRALHQLDHVVLGLLVFLAGAVYARTHQYHHARR